MTHAQPVRIAMWSGPRNISTAMMRAWENRPDTIVVDEPLYAHYLRETGLDHPGRDEIVASGDPDWRSVVKKLCGALPDGVTISYQKHMAHHLLPGIGRDWLSSLTHCFLIRHPREVVLSYTKARPDMTAEDIGFPQQLEIFERIADATGTLPPVIDAADFLRAPEAMLRALCTRLGVAFCERMLAWPPGPRDSDGVWAKYWYAAVERSTGFEAWRPREGDPDPRYAPVIDTCLPIYERLATHRLTVS